MQVPQSPEANAFIKLLTSHQSRLHAYILSLLCDPDFAADVLQETNVVIWNKSDDFKLGTNFAAWAFHIAFVQVLAARQKKSRDRLVFSDEMLQGLASQSAKACDDMEARQQALHHCLGEINDLNRQLLRCRYESGQTVLAIAEQFKLKANSIAQMLHRTRVLLMDCIKGRLAGENRP